MFLDFFKTAVVGPIASKPLAVAGSCANCVAASDPRHAQPCAGFGPGCLAAPGKVTEVNRLGRRTSLD